MLGKQVMEIHTKALRYAKKKKECILLFLYNSNDSEAYASRQHSKLWAVDFLINTEPVIVL